MVKAYTNNLLNRTQEIKTANEVSGLRLIERYSINKRICFNADQLEWYRGISRLCQLNGRDGSFYSLFLLN